MIEESNAPESEATNSEHTDKSAEERPVYVQSVGRIARPENPTIYTQLIGRMARPTNN